MSGSGFPGGRHMPRLRGQPSQFNKSINFVVKLIKPSVFRVIILPLNANPHRLSFVSPGDGFQSSGGREGEVTEIQDES